MDCSRCRAANRDGARFCRGCGAPLKPRCVACGAENEPDAQFCDSCGARVATGPTDETSRHIEDARSVGDPSRTRYSTDAAARKVVTIVFADLVGSTSLHERLDAESARSVMERYYRVLHGAVEAHGGKVVKLLGDGVMAAFGVPRVAEDDAVRAVRAAMAMQRAFQELVAKDAETAGTGLRVAVNTGEVVVGEDQADVVGDPVNVAARLQQEAGVGEVLIGESTRRLVGELVTLAPVGALALKGRAETVGAYRVLSLDRPSGAAAIPFVGRDEELRRIMAVHDAALETRKARLAVILGSPGLGKSRLIAEISRRLGTRALVLNAHCDAAGGATFAPLAEALRAVVRVEAGVAVDALPAGRDAMALAADRVLSLLPSDEHERVRIANGVAALLAGTPALPEETFFVVRRLLIALGRSRPVVLAIDDVQWAEPLLLDLVEHLVEWTTDAPLLVLGAARPELRDVRSSLIGLAADVVTLAGLDAGPAMRLAANVIGAAELPASIAGRVLATSEGNPLFVGELVRMLVHDGVLKREGDRWIAGVALADVEMPPSIHALLAARIERLRPEERSILERAAVVGRQFSRAAVEHLLPQPLPDLDARIEALHRSELIERDAGWFFGEPALRFHHVLIRDAAYRRLLKETRAELHARLADWLEARVGEAIEHDETIGWHLEQAYQHLRELGRIDGRARELGARAARHLAAAGRRALARDDLSLAASLLGRALELLDREDSARADLAIDCCEAMLAAGEVGPAVSVVEELGRLATASERLQAWHTCFEGQLAVMTDPQALRATAASVSAAATVLAAGGDAAGEAKAYSVVAGALGRLGKVGECEAALDSALAAARRAGDRRRANAVLAGAPLAALWGPSPVTRASGRCLDVVRVLRITHGAPAVEAVALRCQAVLEALRGRTDAARRMIASSRAMVEELGITHRLLEADVFAGLIELLENDAIAAERCLRTAYDGLRERGLRIDAAQAAALLGRALLAQGRAPEAEALSHESEELAGDDLNAAIAWRGVRAEALARRGEHAAAVDLAQAGVEIAATTDALLIHADARLALAAALRAAGRAKDADAEEAHAIDLWEAKGATVLAERVRRGAVPAGTAARAIDAQAETGRPVRRIRANAATAMAARVTAAVVDVDAFSALLADDYQCVDHPTGAVFGRDAFVAWLRTFRADDFTFEHEHLATLGDSLALCRETMSFTGFAEDLPVGAVHRELLVLTEVDANGRHSRAEFFAADKLAESIARLYERYAELLPEGGERTRAEATARSLAVYWERPFQLESRPAILARDVEFLNHCRLGFENVRGAEAITRRTEAYISVADAAGIRIEDVLAVRSDIVLVSYTTWGAERSYGAEYESRMIELTVFDANGLITRIEQFDWGHEDDALARFDELTTAPRETPLANAAYRSIDRFERCWRERDWDGLVASFSPSHVMDDRRALFRMEVAGEDFLGNERMLFDIPTSRWTSELIATRGERLALVHMRFAAELEDGGPMAVEMLDLVEIDGGGRRVALVVFDPDDLDAAYAELNERQARVEGSAGRRIH